MTSPAIWSSCGVSWSRGEASRLRDGLAGGPQFGLGTLVPRHRAQPPEDSSAREDGRAHCAAAPGAATRRRAARSARVCSGGSRWRAPGGLARTLLADRVFPSSASQRASSARRAGVGAGRPSARNASSGVGALPGPAGPCRRFHRVGHRRQCDDRIEVRQARIGSASSWSAAGGPSRVSSMSPSACRRAAP